MFESICSVIFWGLMAAWTFVTALDVLWVLYVIPGHFCMCHEQWEPGETVLEKTSFGGYGGTTIYHRPGICVHW